MGTDRQFEVDGIIYTHPAWRDGITGYMFTRPLAEFLDPDPCDDTGEFCLCGDDPDKLLATYPCAATWSRIMRPVPKPRSFKITKIGHWVLGNEWFT